VLQQYAKEIAWLDLPDARVQLDVDTPEAYASLTAVGPLPAEPRPPGSETRSSIAGREPIASPGSASAAQLQGDGHGFCQRCATPLQMLPSSHDNGRLHPTCPACHFVVWHDPKVAVLAVVPWEGGILLGRRTEHPGVGLWSFPSGFVDRGEQVEEALLREVLEETGLTVDILGLIGVYSERGNPVVVIAYAVEPRGGTLSSDDDLTDLQGYPVDRLPEMAFEHDEQIVRDWLALRERLAAAGTAQ
jgi:ADP-ribose pyrophosphatase YjhB (NUDIX family)